MTELSTCDICGRSESDLQKDSSNKQLKLELNEDGLWICTNCQANLTMAPTSQGDEIEQDERIKELVGKSAGAICHTLNLPSVPPIAQLLKLPPGLPMMKIDI